MSGKGVATNSGRRLEGKVCIITGGGHGFGETMAKAFANEGARIVVAEINKSEGTRVESDIQSSHGKETAIFQQADVTSRASWEGVLKRTLDVFGKVDVVVNNAGTTYPKKDSHTVTEDEWDKVINVNMKSIYLSTAVIIPHFMQQGSGVVLNVSSVGGIRVKNGLVSLFTAFSNTLLTTGLGMVWWHESFCE